ncbi:MAG: sugar phosphate isomerase/epimerase [Clostridia bacterium]|nr:sugar phosphate isomerase/epimerase [Clostridia bacterium]
MTRIGVQTFTIRHAQKKDIRAAYMPLIRLGIKRYEVARIDFNKKNAMALRELVESEGIEIASIQVKPKYVFGEPEEIISFCKTVGCKNVVISMLPFGCILGKEKKFYDFLGRLDAQYALYEKSGITLAYHHHNWEYVTLSNGKTRMEELLSKTERIKFVSDTYWTAGCGISPAAQLYAFGERLLGVHLRDLTHSARGIKVIPKNCPVGEGVIDFSAVIRAASDVGAEYLVIEEKTDTPYENIEKSYRNIERILEASE